MSNWYLVYSKARQEDVAAKGLREQGYDVYLPKLQVRKRRAQGMVEVVQPLFPRYLFVASSSADQSITQAQYTAGVQKLVKFGVQYLPVSRSVVAVLVSREDPETGLHTPDPPAFKRGEKLRITSGALAGVEAVFEARTGQDRVIVLLNMLGQQARAEVHFDELER